MKITKRQLRRIIKEEKARLLKEIRGEESVGLHPQGKNTSGGPQSAYGQGFEAGSEGNRDAMPLDKYGTKFYDAWMEGWDDGLGQLHGGGSY